MMMFLSINSMFYFFFLCIWGEWVLSARSPPQVRKKLDLKPRSEPIKAEDASASSTEKAADYGKSKPDPFGGARPKDQLEIQRKIEEKLREKDEASKKKVEEEAAAKRKMEEEEKEKLKAKKKAEREALLAEKEAALIRHRTEGSNSSRKENQEDSPKPSPSSPTERQVSPARAKSTEERNTSRKSNSSPIRRSKESVDHEHQSSHSSSNSTEVRGSNNIREAPRGRGGFRGNRGRGGRGASSRTDNGSSGPGLRSSPSNWRESPSAPVTKREILPKKPRAPKKQEEVEEESTQVETNKFALLGEDEVGIFLYFFIFYFFLLSLFAFFAFHLHRFVEFLILV